MLNIKLPFYGQRGSIAQIIEEDKEYKILTYDIEGKISNNEIKVKKTKNNQTNLLNNYYKNALEYLELNKEKYNDVKNREIKKLIDKKLIKLIGILPLATSILIESSILWTLGTISLILGSVSTTISIVKLNELKDFEEILEFKNIYSNLVNEYNIYKKFKEEEKVYIPTKTRTLDPSDRSKDKNSILIKIKKTYQNVK